MKEEDWGEKREIKRKKGELRVMNEENKNNRGQKIDK